MCHNSSISNYKSNLGVRHPKTFRKAGSLPQLRDLNLEFSIGAYILNKKGRLSCGFGQSHCQRTVKDLKKPQWLLKCSLLYSRTAARPGLLHVLMQWLHERLPGMREVCGSIPGRVKQKDFNN